MQSIAATLIFGMSGYYSVVDMKKVQDNAEFLHTIEAQYRQEYDAISAQLSDNNSESKSVFQEIRSINAELSDMKCDKRPAYNRDLVKERTRKEYLENETSVKEAKQNKLILQQKTLRNAYDQITETHEFVHRVVQISIFARELIVDAKEQNLLSRQDGYTGVPSHSLCVESTPNWYEFVQNVNKEIDALRTLCIDHRSWLQEDCDSKKALLNVAYDLKSMLNKMIATKQK